MCALLCNFFDSTIVFDLFICLLSWAHFLWKFLWKSFFLCRTFRNDERTKDSYHVQSCTDPGADLKLGTLFVVRSTCQSHLLFENPMTFNCFWAIKNFQLTLMRNKVSQQINFFSSLCSIFIEIIFPTFYQSFRQDIS